MTTLMFERGAADGSNRERAEADAKMLGRVVSLATRADRDGGKASDDPVFRDQLAELWIDLEAIRFGSQRAGIAGLCTDHPGALKFMHKLVFSEFIQRLSRLACEMLGSEAMLWLDDANAPDNAEWPRAYMNSYGFTVGGGTSEIQRNILGERIMGLPKSK